MARRALRNFTISRSSPWFQGLVLGASMLFCLISAVVYWYQPDSCASLLLFPRWVWLVFGSLLALLGWTKQRKIPASVVMIIWLLYAFVFVEEVASLTRWRRWPSLEWQAAQENGTAIRIVSLNCSGGDEDAAAEVINYMPDIVLFQESPLRTKLPEIAQRVFGPEAQALCGPDVSIIARGQLTPVTIPRPWDIPFSHAHVRFASGLTAEVIVVRLPPYGIRADFWSPDCWRQHCQNRQRQRQHIEWLVQHIKTIPPDVPLIVGGDFNQPGGDAIMRALQPRLRDAFHKSGRGWGNTMDNDFPILRIDQIWVSSHFRAASVVARRTVHSDHRMVVCDLIRPRDTDRD